MRKLVFGVGLNDADYTVKPTVMGKRLFCPFYRKWQDMLKRCYDKSYIMKQPTYNGCSVCDEWLTFSKFKSWMINQDWHNKQLDKDILVNENKVYSSEFCVFVDAKVNSFLTDRAAMRGSYMIGVHFNSVSKKLVSQCNNPITGKLETLGYFNDEMSAHLAWKKRKHELACQLADLQTDGRVAAALRLRYAT